MTAAAAADSADVSMEDIPSGTVLDLDRDDLRQVYETIREYDPKMADIQAVVRSEGVYLIDVALEDGALWQMYWHPVRLMCVLRKLGATVVGKPLTADLACAYSPSEKDRTVGTLGNLARIPAVDCGDGFRQLEFNEKILPTDEWYGGPRQGWAATSETDGNYWPSHSNSIHGPYSLMRRRVQKV